MPTLQKKVDLIFVHKDPNLGFIISYLVNDLNKKVDTYYQPQKFLENVDRYPKDTKIILGRRFHDGVPQGIQMAEHLHALGFTRLYLTSVINSSEEALPAYLTFIGCPDLNGIESFLNE